MRSSLGDSSPLLSPQPLVEGPPLQPRPNHLRPTEEELPPPPEEPVGFPEREASTGMGTGTEGLCVTPRGPRAASMSFQGELGEQGPPRLSQLTVW